MRFAVCCLVITLATGTLQAEPNLLTCGLEWRTIAVPPARAGHAMVYYPPLDGLLMFGGRDVNGIHLGDTWLYQGGRWQLLPGPNPPARHRHAMTYDPVRGVVVLYGGQDNDFDSLDTWEFSDGCWREVGHGSDAGPRSDFSLVFDPIRSEVLAVGGAPLVAHAWDGTTWQVISDNLSTPAGWQAFFDTNRNEVIAYGAGRSSDTVRLVGDTWEEITSAGPGFQGGARVVWDPQHSVAILAGGVGDDGRSETWEWNSTFWRKRTDFDPVRSEAALAFDPTSNSIVWFGGSGPFGGGLRPVYNDMRTWNGTSWFGPNERPQPRAGHALAMDEAAGTLVVLGGQADGLLDPDLLDRTWSRGADGWNEAPGLGPGPVIGGDLVYDSIRDVLVLTEGRFQDGTRTGTWERRLGIWQRVADAPTSETRGAVYDSKFGGVLMIGVTGNCATTWFWDGAFWSPLAGAAELCGGGALVRNPTSGAVLYLSGQGALEWNAGTWQLLPGTDNGPALGNLAATYNPSENNFIVFTRVGGSNGVTETWAFTPGTGWSLLNGAGPDRASGFTLGYVPSTSEVLLFGGRFFNQQVADPVEYRWSGDRWVPVQPTVPAPRVRSSFAYDPARDEFLLFGGDNGVQSGAPEYFGDAWLLRDGSWQSVPVGPAPRSGASACFDPSRDAILVCGGRSVSGEMRDLWQWDGSAWENLLPDEPQNPGGDVNQLLYDPRRGNVVCFASDGLYELVNGVWAGPEPLPFSPSFGATATYDPQRGGPLIYEGLFGGAWVQTGLDPNDWQELTNPPGFIFGALRYSKLLERPLWLTPTADQQRAYVLDPNDTWREVPINNAAAPRYDGGADIDPSRQEIVFAFGRNATTQQVLNDTRILSLGLITGDLDYDGNVGLTDLAVLLQAFGGSDAGDLDGDGETTLSDLAMLLVRFGLGCL